MVIASQVQIVFVFRIRREISENVQFSLTRSKCMLTGVARSKNGKHKCVCELLINYLGVCSIDKDRWLQVGYTFIVTRSSFHVVTLKRLPCTHVVDGHQGGVW